VDKQEQDFWDAWVLEAAAKMVLSYGHSWGAAMGLARLQRDMLRSTLAERPQSMFVVTGI
jgi:hypothetical protein